MIKFSMSVIIKNVVLINDVSVNIGINCYVDVVRDVFSDFNY